MADGFERARACAQPQPLPPSRHDLIPRTCVLISSDRCCSVCPVAVLERTRDFRPDYKLNLTEPQAANMHPIQTAIAVRQSGGGGAKLTVTPDRSQAGTSLVDGQLELLVHRRKCSHAFHRSASDHKDNALLHSNKTDGTTRY